MENNNQSKTNNQNSAITPQEVNFAKWYDDVLKNADLSADVAKKFKAFSNGIDFSATTLGAILSCNIVTPLARNYIAAKRQQASIAKLDAAENVPAKVTEKPFFARPTMVDFQGARFSTYGSGSGLKI